MADDTQSLLRDIDAFCGRTGIAQTTFGRLAVNDGKFVARARSGATVREKTRERVYAFIREVDRGERKIKGRSNRKHEVATRTMLASMAAKSTIPRSFSGPEQHELRQRHHHFINTCNERWILADRAFDVLSKLPIQRPALRLFDASLGDGTVLTRVLRASHKANPTLPHIVVTKERALDDLRNSLGKMADRFLEHPLMVLVITNLNFKSAVSLKTDSLQSAMALNWQDVPLEGNTAYDFQQQISALHAKIATEWMATDKPEEARGPKRPIVIVLYRSDYRYVLDSLIPKPGGPSMEYDFIIGAHLFRHRASTEFKLGTVLRPLYEALAPGGRLFFAQAHGNDPGHEIIRRLWPDSDEWFTSRHEVIRALRKESWTRIAEPRITGITDKQSLFRYDMHTLPVDPQGPIGTSTLLAAWNNATFVAQVPQADVDEVMRGGVDYLSTTADVIKECGGLWFINESFVLSRS